MTEDQLDLLLETKNQYWLDFSKLVNHTLTKVPVELREYLKEMLQETSSVYGRKTDG